MHYTQLVHFKSGYELRFGLDFLNVTPLVYLNLYIPSTHAGRWAWPGAVKNQDKMLIEVWGACVIQPPCSNHFICSHMQCVCISISMREYSLSPILFLFSFQDMISHWTESSLTGQAGWPESSQDAPVCFPVLGLQEVYTIIPSFWCERCGYELKSSCSLSK